jgi:hypothetical protein
MIKMIKLVEDNILNGPGAEDPNTTGLKNNIYPIVPKQGHTSSYDVLDEKKSVAINAIDAGNNYINGNISDFKSWLQDDATTKTEIMYVITGK